MSESTYPWMHAGAAPEAIGADGYPVFPGDPRRDIQLALNECLAAIERDYMAHLHLCWSEDPAVSEPAKAEPYRERDRAESAILREFIESRPGEWPALFHATLDRVLWLNFGGYAWESTCEAVEAIRQQVAREHPQHGYAMSLYIELPEGESLEWRTSLKYGGRTLYSSTSDEQFHGGSHMRRWDLQKVLLGLLRRKVAWSADDVRRMLETIASASVVRWMLSPPSVLRVAGRFVAEHGMSPEIRELLGRVKAKHEGHFIASAANRKVIAQVDQILGKAPAPDPLGSGECWAEAARADLAGMDEGGRAAWTALLDHARTGGGIRPSDRWLRRARGLVAAVGEHQFTDHVARWFALVGQPRAVPTGGTPLRAADPTLLSEPSVALLRGLAWCCGLAPVHDSRRALADLAESCFSKVPNVGARSAKVGNACLAALVAMPGPELVPLLVRLESRVMHPVGRRRIEAALAEANGGGGR